MIIYLVTNKVTGRQYVGQTIFSMKKRWVGHGKDNSYISKSIRKYGKKKFKLEVIEKCKSEEEMNKREIFWIKRLNVKRPNGYNLTDGGEGTSGWKASAKTRKKMSAIRKGKKFSSEHKKNLSEALKNNSPWKGKHLTQKHKDKLSIAFLGKNNHFYGKKHTEETREALKNIATGKKASEETKKKMSLTRKGKIYGPYPRTEEMKRKMREAWVKRKNRKISND